jgi:hypothetical protein
MTIRLSFDLSTVHDLAEHAIEADWHFYRAGGCTITAAALLLSSGDGNGVWLSSNGLPAPSAPADQPGTLDRPAAFAIECPPGTPWLDQVHLLHGEHPLAVALPLHEPDGHPLIAQLRDGAQAGFTTLRILLSGTGLDIAVSRHRDRSRRAFHG